MKKTNKQIIRPKFSNIVGDTILVRYMDYASMLETYADYMEQQLKSNKNKKKNTNEKDIKQRSKKNSSASFS